MEAPLESSESSDIGEDSDEIDERDEVVDQILAKMNENRRLVKIETKVRIAEVSRVLPPAHSDGASRAVFKTVNSTKKRVIFEGLWLLI